MYNMFFHFFSSLSFLSFRRGGCTKTYAGTRLAFRNHINTIRLCSLRFTLLPSLSLLFDYLLATRSSENGEGENKGNKKKARFVKQRAPINKFADHRHRRSLFPYIHQIFPTVSFQRNRIPLTIKKYPTLCMGGTAII